MRDSQFLNYYQYAAPLLLTPLSYWLWLQSLGEAWLVVQVISIPILVSYIVPAIGTNRLYLWEFHTRFMLGRFRWHHGFVFGSATNILTYLSLEHRLEPFSLVSVLRTGLVLGAVLGLLNWIYDIAAIRAGFIKVFIKVAHDGCEPEAVAAQYAPMYFGTFGVFYGVYVRLAEYSLTTDLLAAYRGLLWLLGFALVLVMPCALYVLQARLTTGSNGLTRYERVG